MASAASLLQPHSDHYVRTGSALTDVCTLQVKANIEYVGNSTHSSKIKYAYVTRILVWRTCTLYFVIKLPTASRTFGNNVKIIF